MSKHTNIIADEIAAEIAEQVEQVEQVTETEQVEQVNEVPSADLVIESLLEQFKPTETLTAYQIHVIANIAFELLGTTVIDSKTGIEQIKQIAPQYVYNKTKGIRASKGEGARFDLNEVRDVVSSIVGGTKSTVSSKDRLDKNSMRANALKALKG